MMSLAPNRTHDAGARSGLASADAADTDSRLLVQPERWRRA
jgi:hypothetical protein